MMDPVTTNSRRLVIGSEDQSVAAQDIPHLSATLIDKYVTDLHHLGLL
jgi:hypothetical protein